MRHTSRPFVDFPWRTGGAILVAAAMMTAVARGQSPGMVEFLSSGKVQRGLALAESIRETVVLGRDGQLHWLDPRSKTNVRKVSGAYQPLSAVEMSNQLRAEFGTSFEVVPTNNFLVVQPKGRGKTWPDMFEQSHRSFTTYMSKRGVRIRQGRFPMVAIVYPDQRSMYAEFRKRKLDVSRVSGLYHFTSNRVMTHDGGRIDQVAATVRHEAAHQSAANSGVHSRLSDTPRWITEGIGQMFEPPAMSETRSGSSVENRINRESMWVIAQKYSKPGDVNFDRGIVQLIGDDTMFEDSKSIDNAYALSWAMMFYLAERDTKSFAKLLNWTAQLPAFEDYEKAKRLRDFQKLVGVKPYEFSRRVRRYLEKLEGVR